MIALPFRLGGYGTIAADPPWRFSDPGGNISPGYALMDDRAILELPVNDLRARKSHLYLWTTDSHLDLALRCMERWGYVYKRAIVWVKVTRDPLELRATAAQAAADLTTGQVRETGRALKLLAHQIGRMFIGGGHYVRSSHELCLLGVSGGLVPPPADRLPSVIMAPPVRGTNGRPVHSRKPDQLLVRAERVSPAPRIELFARRARAGWACWGDQAPREVSNG